MKTLLNLIRSRILCGGVLVALGLSLVPIMFAASTFTDANWSSMGGFPGANGEVTATATDNAGNLYIGGYFTVVGDVIANGIAKWDGVKWSPLRTGKDSYVNALAVIGSDVYAAGAITAGGVTVNIARWDGSNWSALGSGINGPEPTDPGYVSALAVSGGDLYAGGTFTTAGGIAALNIAKWDGSSWSALGSGFNDGVSVLAASGPNLYASDGVNSLAKWDGNRWSALPLGLSNTAGGVGPHLEALAAFGSGVYVAGAFTNVAGIAANSIAKWNGSSWSALAAGFLPTGVFQPVVSALAVSGNDLYVGGHFRRPWQDGFVAKWNGTDWSALGALGTGRSGSDYFYLRVNALAVSETNVFAGGVFGVADGDNIAKWDGNNWSAPGSPPGLNSDVYSLAAVGGDLYVTGGFTTAGGVPTENIAKWNGSSWSAPEGFDFAPFFLTVSGSDLYAGGYFTTTDGSTTNAIAKWNGSSWSVLGTGFGTDDVAPRAWALAVSGNDVYAAGRFTRAGGVAATNIAKWDGSSWSALGSGMNSPVFSLVVSGSDVYAGGEFTMAGGVAANRIAKWNGSSWTALGSGLGGTPAVFPYVTALAVSGSDLYVGGRFTMAGGTAANSIAKWDGTNWSALGTGLGGPPESVYVSVLVVSGSDLYAGGIFRTAGGVQANNIAKWNGTSWTSLGSGLGGYGPYGPDNSNPMSVSALAVLGNDLYVGGSFTTAGGKVSPFIARAYLPELPALSVRRSGAEVMVSWPSATAADFTLQQSAGPVVTPNWVTNTQSITDDGEKKSVTYPATNGPQFFRLRRP